jgi:hypothetical protein
VVTSASSAQGTGRRWSAQTFFANEARRFSYFLTDTSVRTAPVGAIAELNPG